MTQEIQYFVHVFIPIILFIILFYIKQTFIQYLLCTDWKSILGIAEIMMTRECY